MAEINMGVNVIISNGPRGAWGLVEALSARFPYLHKEVITLTKTFALPCPRNQSEPNWLVIPQTYAAKLTNG